MEGVRFEPLAVAPEVGLRSDPADPSLGLVLGESGERTVRPDAPLTVTRAGSFAPAVATAEAGGGFVAPAEEAQAGEEATLRAGVVALFPPNAGGEIRNDGAARAVGRPSRWRI